MFATVFTFVVKLAMETLYSIRVGYDFTTAINYGCGKLGGQLVSGVKNICSIYVQVMVRIVSSEQRDSLARSKCLGFGVSCIY